MNIHIATYSLDPTAWNGHAQMIRFVTQGLVAAGHSITATHATTHSGTPSYHFSTLDNGSSWRDISIYDGTHTPASSVAGHWNSPLVDWAAGLLEAHRVDVVYAQGGDDILDVVAAGSSVGIRCAYHVHDYDLFCGRRFLLDYQGDPCSGPETPRKCFDCLRRQYAWHARTAARLVTIPGVLAATPKPVLPFLKRYDFLEPVERAAVRRRSAVDMVDCFVSTGAAVTRTLMRCGIPPGRIGVLPHMITRPEMRQPPSGQNRQPGPLRVGYFGRVGREKGVTLLARALDSIRRRGDLPCEWRVICNGDSAAVSALFRVAGLSKDMCHHVQRTSAAELRTALRAVDVAVFPSLWPEIGPLALLEALRQGVFSIASDSMCMTEAVRPGISGYVFESGDVESLERAIRKAATHPYVLGVEPRRPLIEAGSEEAYFGSLVQLLMPDAPGRDDRQRAGCGTQTSAGCPASPAGRDHETQQKSTG